MAITFRAVEPKTGELLAAILDREVEHSYLEQRLAGAIASGQIPGNTEFYVATLYEGISAADLVHLKEQQGLYALGSNRSSAYFCNNQQVADWIRQEIFTNHSDQVAYFNVVMSPAQASTVVERGRVLVIDDEQPDDAPPTCRWGRRKAKDREGNLVPPELLNQAHQSLGDGYCLIAPDLHRQVSRDAAIEQAHQGVDEGRLSVAQFYSLPGAELEKGEWKAASVGELLAFHLEEAIGRALPVSEDRAISSKAIAAGAASLKLSGLKLDQDSLRGQVATARWSYCDLDKQEVYSGQVLLQRPPDAAQLDLVLVGGTARQRTSTEQAFEAIVAAQLTPFQVRGGVSEWKGGFKGTARAASLCEAIGVDAIIPRSAIKADGQTVPLGISTVKELFWARKSDARSSTQRLGTQVLVNLPQGTEADILPKLAQRQEALAQAMTDPRRLAYLYCESYECRERVIAQEEPGQEESKSEDGSPKSRSGEWLYQLLKTDVQGQKIATGFEGKRWLQERYEDNPNTASRGLDRLYDLQRQQVDLVMSQIASGVWQSEAATQLAIEALGLERDDAANIASYLTTEQVGGYLQILEMPRVINELYKYAQGEWQDTMTGGVYILSATAQPHAMLGRGEICCTDLPHGARVVGYRSPVANVGQMRVLTNNLSAVEQADPEAYLQQGVVYLNKDDAKEMVIDFDIDSVGLIPEQEYGRARTVEHETTAQLGPRECCIPVLAEGQMVTLYYSRGQIDLVNRHLELGEEAARGKGALYLPREVKRHLMAGDSLHYGYYDGLHGFQTLVDEVQYLTDPVRCPQSVEKRTKIPRDAKHPDVATRLSPQEQAIAAQFTSLEQAIVHAAINPTGRVANLGMRLQALRQHLEASDQKAQVKAVLAAGKHFIGLFEAEGIEDDWGRTLGIPGPIKLSDGSSYDFRTKMETIEAVSFIENSSQRWRAAADAVPTLKELLEMTQHRLVDQELQTAVETDKSARPLDEDKLHFVNRLSQFGEVQWIKEKNHPDNYRPIVSSRSGEIVSSHIPQTNTQDPVGRMMAQANHYYESITAELTPGQDLRAYNALIPRLDAQNPQHNALLQQTRELATQYNSSVAQSQAIRKLNRAEVGPRLVLKTAEGQELTVTNLTRFDLKGDSPLWEHLRTGQDFSIQVKLNDALYGIQGKDSKAHSTKADSDSAEFPHQYQVVGYFPNQQGQMEAWSLGTVSLQDEQKRAQELKLADRAGEISRTELVELARLTPNYDQDYAERLLAGAEDMMRDWLKSVGLDPADRAAAFQAMYHAGYGVGEQERTAGSNGRHLAVRLFPDQMLPYLEHYSQKQSKAVGLEYFGAGEPLSCWQDQELTVRTGILDDPAFSYQGRAVWQVERDGQWQTLGLVQHGKGDQVSYRLPLGMEAVARIVNDSPQLGIQATQGGEGVLKVKLYPQHQQFLQEQATNAQAQAQAQISFGWRKGEKQALVYYHPGQGQTPIEIGQVTPKDSQWLQKHPSSLLVKPGLCDLKELATKAVTLELKPETVTRLEPDQTWYAPTVEGWERFCAEQGQGQSQGQTPAQAQPSAQQTSAQLYQERYRATLKAITPALEQIKARSGQLSPQQQDQALAVYLFKQVLKQDPAVNLMQSPVRVEAIYTLWQSPHSQALNQTQGRKAMAKYIETQIKSAIDLVESWREKHIKVQTPKQAKPAAQIAATSKR